MSGSYDALPNNGWMTYPRTVVIKADGSATLDLEVLIPDDMDNYNRKWEEILLIRPDEGIPGFIRVQMETTAEARE